MRLAAYLFLAVLMFAGDVMSGDVMAGTRLSVEDMAGRRVMVPRDPSRIVCLGPGALRLIVYLEAWDKVVGVEDIEKRFPGGRPYALARKELSGLPSIGPGGPASINKKPDFEKVLAVSPDLIFVTFMDARLAQKVQKTLGIPLVVLSYGGFAYFNEEVFSSLELAGRILNQEERAESLVKAIAGFRSDLRRRTKDIPADKKPSVYVGGVGFKGAHGIESTEKKYLPFDWAGAENIAGRISSSDGSHLFLDKERLLRLDPDVIFLDGGGLSMIRQDFNSKKKYYMGLSAFKAGRVYSLLPFNWYVTNIGTAIADSFAIGAALYPDRFADIDVEDKADEIYRVFVGKPVYGKMTENYQAIGAGFLKDGDAL